MHVISDHQFNFYKSIEVDVSFEAKRLGFLMLYYVLLALAS